MPTPSIQMVKDQKMLPKDQIEMICQMLSRDEHDEYVQGADAVWLVRTFIRDTNANIMDLRKRLAMMEAERDEAKKNLHEATHRT